MTLPASGTIGVNNINTELGRASNANTNLNETACRNLAQIASGTIRLSNFYGKAAFGAQWSGNSMAGIYGINVSGNLFRFSVNGSYGAWLSAYTNGTFSLGDSYVSGSGISVPQSNALRVMNTGGYATNWVYFSLTSKFTGASSKTYISSTVYLNTSGGLLQFQINTSYGAWIALN